MAVLGMNVLQHFANKVLFSDLHQQVVPTSASRILGRVY